MLTSGIGTRASGSSGVCSSLQQVTFNSVREMLPDRVIQQACREVGYRYRRRKLTPIVTMLHMILAAIWPEESFQASWQMIWAGAVATHPDLDGRGVSSGSLAKARTRLPVALWQRVWAFLSARVQQLRPPGPTGEGIGSSSSTAPVCRCRRRRGCLSSSAPAPGEGGNATIRWLAW